MDPFSTILTGASINRFHCVELRSSRNYIVCTTSYCIWIAKSLLLIFCGQNRRKPCYKHMKKNLPGNSQRCRIYLYTGKCAAFLYSTIASTGQCHLQSETACVVYYILSNVLLLACWHTHRLQTLIL